MDYYYFPSSLWSRIISVVIAEKQLEPTRHLVDIRVNENFEPAYMRVNPKGVVPTIVDGGESVCNSPRIAEYLDGVGGPPLCNPSGAPAARRWADRLTDFRGMHLSYSVWTLGRKGERSATILDDKVERAGRYAEKYPELSGEYLRKKAYFEAFRADVYDETHREQTRAESRDTLEAIADVVRDSEWLGGGAFSFADCIAMSLLYRLVDLELLHEWHADATHPLSLYKKRLEARPSFGAVWRDDPLLERLKTPATAPRPAD